MYIPLRKKKKKKVMYVRVLCQRNSIVIDGMTWANFQEKCKLFALLRY